MFYCWVGVFRVMCSVSFSEFYFDLIWSEHVFVLRKTFPTYFFLSLKKPRQIMLTPSACHTFQIFICKKIWKPLSVFLPLHNHVPVCFGMSRILLIKYTELYVFFCDNTQICMKATFCKALSLNRCSIGQHWRLHLRRKTFNAPVL